MKHSRRQSVRVCLCVFVQFHSAICERRSRSSKCTRRSCRSFATRDGGDSPCIPPWKTVRITSLPSRLQSPSMASPSTRQYLPLPPNMLKTKPPSSLFSTSLLLCHRLHLLRVSILSLFLTLLASQEGCFSWVHVCCEMPFLNLAVSAYKFISCSVSFMECCSWR